MSTQKEYSENWKMMLEEKLNDILIEAKAYVATVQLECHSQVYKNKQRKIIKHLRKAKGVLKDE